MSLAVQDLLDAPDLPLKLDAARKVLDLEAEQRRRFRDEILPHQKGEFINGRTVMHSPARHSHNHCGSLISRLLGSYLSHAAPGGVLVYEKALCTFSRNDYEPDIVWFSPEKAAAIGPDTMLYPVPDFIVEILSPSTEAHGRGLKRNDYAAHRVGEYWIVDPERRALEPHILPPDCDAYPDATVHTDGEIRPASFPGLVIPHAALFDEAANLEFLRTLLT